MKRLFKRGKGNSIMSATNGNLIETQRRLLEAAGEVFAEMGFNSARIRDICKRAEANVAAVNYHFRDKENLYRETMRYAQVCAGEADFPIEVRPEGNQPKEVRLRGYIRSFLERVLGHGRPFWHTKLMTREMVDPTPILDEIIRDKILSHHQLLLSIMTQYLGSNTPKLVLLHTAGSVLGQILFYAHARPVIQRVTPEAYSPENMNTLAEHIFEFSHAALLHLPMVGSRDASVQ
jgi:TetR/AcrR family transcriptional regulator, regulator of cefoperazone and chloramphenicol sensitivity